MATPEEINSVIEACDIVALVSEYVHLEKTGKNYKGLCPFHNEKTPSFVVTPEKKLAKCFGCGGGGNPITFLEQIENISFGEALERLAERENIKLSGPQAVKKVNPNKKYYDIMNTAVRFYKKSLEASEFGLEAKKYLADRGLDEEVIKAFNIGLSPKTKDSLYKLCKEKFNYLELDMVDVGLIDSYNHDYHDLFVGRIMFPIYDEMGNPIGFSARIFNNPDKNQPKYINTRDTVLYKKGDVIYNLSNAKAEIRKKNRVILHEGQMDVIAAYRSGLKEAVCTMGTALTLSQVQVLKKYTNNVVICYDGDRAGVSSSIKAIKLFKQENFNIHLVLLPDNQDPDEYVKKYGTEEYVKYFENHQLDEFAYVFERAFIGKDLNDSNQVLESRNEIFNILVSSESKIIEERYLRLLANKLQISYDLLLSDYNSYKGFSDDDEFLTSDDYVTPVVNNYNNVFKSNAQIRLFMYAKASKEKALYIDSKLSNMMSGLSLENQILWVNLINNFYEKNDIFDEERFLQSLDNENRAYYFKITDELIKDKNPYNEVDLEACLEKVRLMQIDNENKKLSNQLFNEMDSKAKVDILVNKFKNKQKKNNLQRRAKNGPRDSN